MPTLIERYVAGEHEAVWDELLALGEAVRDPADLPAATAVARETMRRARANVETLIQRLPQIGFAFPYEPDIALRVGDWAGDSVPPYEPPAANAAALVDAFERAVGPVALSLRAWWEVVGGVNLIGACDGWPDVEVLDPLYLDSVDTLQYAEEAYRDWQDLDEEDRLEWPFQIDVAPDALHKANISGGPPYGVRFPSSSADDLFTAGPGTFVQYLRDAFRWGGFPGFATVAALHRPAEQLRFLTDGLLPL